MTALVFFSMFLLFFFFWGGGGGGGGRRGELFYPQFQKWELLVINPVSTSCSKFT